MDNRTITQTITNSNPNPNPNSNSKELEELLNDIKELEHMKQFHESENQTYECQLRQLKGELDGMQISIMSTHALIKSTKDQLSQCLSNINKLAGKKEHLIDRNNRLHGQIKTITTDIQSSNSLQENLINEMNTINEEKKLLLNRFTQIKAGIQTLVNARNNRIPEFKKCNDIIRQMYSSMKKVHHKMEISMIFKRETPLC